MLLSAIRGKISQLPRFRKMLLAILLTIGALAIIFILVEVVVFFYFGYYRESIPMDKAKNQGWTKGEFIEIIEGEVVEVKDSVLVIEKDGEKEELAVDDKVYFCEEGIEGTCVLGESNLIKMGQALRAYKSIAKMKASNWNQRLNLEWLVYVWD
jgi:hypothetical protein